VARAPQPAVAATRRGRRGPPSAPRFWRPQPEPYASVSWPVTARLQLRGVRQSCQYDRSLRRPDRQQRQHPSHRPQRHLAAAGLKDPRSPIADRASGWAGHPEFVRAGTHCLRPASSARLFGAVDHLAGLLGLPGFGQAKCHCLPLWHHNGASRPQRPGSPRLRYPTKSVKVRGSPGPPRFDSRKPVMAEVLPEWCAAWHWPSRPADGVRLSRRRVSAGPGLSADALVASRD
jgi:hypothetical protein